MVSLNKIKFSGHNFDSLVSKVNSDDHKYDMEIEKMARQHGAVKIRIITDYECGLKTIIHDVFFESASDKEAFENDLAKKFPQ